MRVKEFLKKELERAGCGEIDVQRTPLGTRVILKAQRPGLVIG
ncbi:MAG: KH domain-containing protein, partial [Candidatus Hydrothermarchaeaceae archaeon]